MDNDDISSGLTEEEAELAYGKPDTFLREFKPHKCEHFFIRTSATEFGCKSCSAHWLNSTWKFENGKLVE